MRLRTSILTAALGGLLSISPAHAQSLIGTDVNGIAQTPILFGSLEPLVEETGFITVSADGLGITASTGNIRVQKPSAGATVRSAYLMSASTGFSSYQIPNGAGGVTLAGTPITWDISIPNNITSYNYWADVTTIVKPIVDVAPPGIIPLAVIENNSAEIDGEALAVIFDDPTQTTVTTVILLFGAQNTSGDTFKITLSDPIDLTEPNLVLDMGLGISFGFQEVSEGGQFSYVYVDTQLMTSSAGGQDDGQEANGALITVGGIGDTDADPPPTESAAVDGDRTDDELYSLIPFVKNGDTSITVFTQNPSGDDNIFFAYFRVSGGAVANAGILLSPDYAENIVGNNHTVTALVQDGSGNPVAGQLVTFLITAGPNKNLTGTGTTGPDGKTTFTYTSSSPGVDTITASAKNADGSTVTSNEALKQWCEPVTIAEALAGNRGIYKLTASSDCFTASQLNVYVKDSASAFVAGPYASGTIVRIVRGATPSTGPGTSTASVTITVKGNGLAYATDPLNSTSSTVTLTP